MTRRASGTSRNQDSFRPLIPKPTVTLDAGILDRLARVDEVQADPAGVRPLIERVVA
jgi:hypothetical protein